MQRENKLELTRIVLPLPDDTLRRICSFSNPKDKRGDPYVKLVFPDLHGQPLERTMQDSRWEIFRHFRRSRRPNSRQEIRVILINCAVATVPASGCGRDYDLLTSDSGSLGVRVTPSAACATVRLAARAASGR